MRMQKYNPAFLNASERMLRFGARHHELDELVRILRENLSRSTNQHVLLVGSRGMGKTTLLLRVADEILRNQDLAAGWIPIIAPEEIYRATTIGELWLEIVFSLGRATSDASHERVYERLKQTYNHPSSENDERQLESAALAYLLDFADRSNRRLVVICENLQMLFGEQLSTRDAWALRETLIHEPRIMFLGSAVTFFREIEDATAPLFEQFLVHYIEPLDTDGCLDLWQRVTGDVLPRRRMRALEILTGGNPRLLVILAEFAGKLSLHDLTGDLTNLIDDHTDYLKMTTESLPTLERKVFVTLAEIWDYASAAQVASQARVDVNVASAQLGRLTTRGAVVGRVRGRGKQYRVAERLYCIYHLMRRRGGAAARARAAIEFMVAYYDTPSIANEITIITEEALTLEPKDRMEHFLIIGGLLENAIDGQNRGKIASTISRQLFALDDVPDSLKDLLHQSEMQDESLRNSRSKPRVTLPRILASAMRVVDKTMKNGSENEIINALQNFVKACDEYPPKHHKGFQQILANTLQELSNRQANMGYREDGLESVQRLVEIWRSQEKNNPGSCLPDLAMGLNNLGIRLSELGRREEALAPTQEAVEIRRQLATTNPGAFMPDLAMSLNNLGIMLSELGRREEALAPTREAVEIRRQLATTNPGAFMPDLAMSLNNLGVSLSELGRRDEALALTQEAVEIRRQLATTNPGAFMPDLARSLNNLGNSLSNLGRRDEALAPTQEAVEIRRQLATTNPGAFMPDLAMSLNNLGVILSKLGRRDEGLAPAQEAVEIYRQLAKDNPGAIMPDLASSLNNLGIRLSELGRREEALAPTQEAVEIRRQLATTNPGAFMPDLAMSLNNLGVMLSELGRRDEALAPAQEAADIYRQLATTNPGAFMPDLASSLNNLGIRLSELGRREEALALTQEAVEIRRQLATTNPGAFMPDLTLGLNNLGISLSNLGRREEALAPTQEAVEIRRQLATTNPSAFMPDLASSLNNLGIMLSELGRRDEALAPAQEAVEIYRQLAKDNPGAFMPDLASSLNNLGIRLSELGRRDEALAPSQEAVEIRRQLAKDNPGAFMPDLASSLNNLGISLSDLGRRDEALQTFIDAAKTDPGNLRVRYSLGSEYLNSGRITEALEELRLISGNVDHQEGRIRAVIRLTTSLVNAGAAQDSYDCLKTSALATHIEPLLVALSTWLGQETDAPDEIEAIAKDIADHFRVSAADFQTKEPTKTPRNAGSLSSERKFVRKTSSKRGGNR